MVFHSHLNFAPNLLTSSMFIQGRRGDYERVVMALIMTSTLIEDAAGDQECQAVAMFDGLFRTDKEAESVVCSWVLHNQCLTSKQIAENGLEKSQQRHRFPVLSASEHLKFLFC